MIFCQLTPGGKCFLSIIERIEPQWGSHSLQDVSKDGYKNSLEMLEEEIQRYSGREEKARLYLTEVSLGFLRSGESIHFFYLK